MKVKVQDPLPVMDVELRLYSIAVVTIGLFEFDFHDADEELSSRSEAAG